MNTLINLPTLFTAVIIAVLTSVLSVYLALKKYRTEKWWEKKLECYISTINAMNDIIRFCDNVLAEEFEGKAVPDDLVRELDSKLRKSRILLDTQTNIGQLLMSKEAYSDLLNFDRILHASEQESDFIKQISSVRVETENCLSTFITRAKNDLGVI